MRDGQETKKKKWNTYSWVNRKNSNCNLFLLGMFLGAPGHESVLTAETGLLGSTFSEVCAFKYTPLAFLGAKGQEGTGMAETGVEGLVSSMLASPI